MEKELILQALRRVIDPDLNRDIVTLGFVKDLKIDGAKVCFTLELTTPACPLKDRMKKEAEEALLSLKGIEEVDIKITSKVRPADKSVRQENLLPDVKNVIAVASGKGGVGKSTVSVNLAAALAMEGAGVGLVDLDIYGPSIPMMMGVTTRPVVENKKLVTLKSHGVKLMSLGFLVPDNAPLIWRGPMVMGAVEQLLKDVNWGDLDYLIVDLPPGTGDAQLTLTQKVPLTGAVIVTTPQDVALLDATKGLEMFRKVDVEVLGIIENMSYFHCPHCGGRTDIFSHGGGRRASEKGGAPFLGDIPLNVGIREGGDEGKPIVVSDPDGPIGQTFRNVARSLAARISVRSYETAGKD